MKAQNIGWLVVIFIIGAAIILNKQTPHQPYAPTDSDAFYITKQFVEKNLKAPATADFASITDTRITHAGDTYFVVSYVDAQNSFGAQVRTVFNATVQHNGDGKWTLVKLDM